MCRYLAPAALAIFALVGPGALAQPRALPAEPAALEHAQGPSTISLGEAIQLAMDMHPELAAARRAVEAAEGSRLQALARPNPTLDAQMEDPLRQSRTTTFTWTQPIELGGKRAARTAVADRSIQLAQSQLQSAQILVQSRVVSVYFSALMAQERVALAQTSLDVARKGSDAASKRVAAGKVSPVEETRALAAQAAVQLELLQAQGELRGALLQLAGAIGRTAPLAAVDGNATLVPELPSEPDVDMRVDDAPAMREARAEAQRLQAIAELERTRRTPDLSLTLGAKRPSEPARMQPVIGVSVTLPLFDNNSGNIQEAIKRQLQAEEVARTTRLRLTTEAATARQRVATAIAESTTLRDELIPRAQSAFEAASKGFELGKFSYLEALDAQRTLLQARMQYLRALADAQQASAELRRLLGLSAGPEVFNPKKETS